MKAKLSFIAAVAITALAVGVPAAFAEGRLAGAPKSTDGVAYFRANELATAAASGLDGVAYFRANELATAAQSGSTTVASYRDAAERAVPQPQSSPVTPTIDSASDIEWGQIGIAFGVGLLLALGLTAALRFRPTRPLAQ